MKVKQRDATRRDVPAQFGAASGRYITVHDTVPQCDPNILSVELCTVRDSGINGFSVSCLARRPSQGRELAWPPPVNHLWPAAEPGLPLRQRPQADGWEVTPQTNYTSVFNPRFCRVWGPTRKLRTPSSESLITASFHCFQLLLNCYNSWNNVNITFQSQNLDEINA